MNIKELKSKYDEYYKSLKGFTVVLSILNFDCNTIAPKKSLEENSNLYTAEINEIVVTINGLLKQLSAE